MALDEYDPDIPPPAREWLELDEVERLELVRSYHEESGATLANARLHSAIHVVIENQLALGDPAIVERTVQRLQREGLSRHDAIHAIGGAVAEFLFEVTDTPPRDPKGLMGRYEERLAHLSASAFLDEDE